MLPIAIFWLIFACAIVAPARFTVYLFFVSISFRMFATLPLEISGGVTLMPQAVIAPVMGARLLLDFANWSHVQDFMLDWRKLGLLTAFLLIGLCVTITAPLVFAGVPVIELNTGNVIPLGFRATNATQIFYLSSSFLVIVSFWILLQTENGRRIIARGIMLGGAMACASGLLDMATAGTTILAPLRTGSYALLNDNQMNGVRRVIGFCPEASTYGWLTLSFATTLLFMRPARLLGGWWRMLEMPLAALLLLCAILSTSSGTYVGIVFALAVLLTDLLYRIVGADSPGGRDAVRREAVAASFIVLALAILVISRHDLVRQAYEMIDAAVFKKTTTDSYVTRKYFTDMSMAAWRATGGMGVGIGSTLASSYPVVVLASTGVAGAGFMLAFLARMLLGPLPRGDETLGRMAIGARYCTMIAIVPALGAGTLIDFGPFNALFFAVMAGAPSIIAPEPWQRRRSRAAANGPATHARAET